ncbi:MAG: hypothetical protein AAF197_08725 [Pseudomonadota bacterium]
MAYDYWALYEKHLNAFRRDHTNVYSAFRQLGTHLTSFRSGMKSPNQFTRQKAKRSFIQYLDTTVKATFIAERQGGNARAKLDGYIRRKGNFNGSSDHYRNIDASVASIRNQRGTLQNHRRKAIQMF